MMLSHKKLEHKTNQILWGLKYLNPKGVQTFALKSSQVFIGSSEKCDSFIAHKSIAPFHALLLVTDEGVEIIDLTPQDSLIGGLYINGHKVMRAKLLDHDKFQLGELSFCLQSEILLGEFEQFSFGKRSEKKQSSPSASTAVLPPPFGIRGIVPHSDKIHYHKSSDKVHDKNNQRHDLVLIDDEYCDLVFKETSSWDQQSFARKNPLKFKFGQNFVDDTVEDSSQVATFLMPSLQVKPKIILSYYCAGNLVSLESIDTQNLKKNAWTFKHLPPELKTFFKEDDIILKEKNNAFYFKVPMPLQKSVLHDLEQGYLKIEDRPVVLAENEKGSEHQMVIQLEAQKYEWNSYHFWRSKMDHLQLVKYFSALFIPFLLLLFVAIPELKEPPKEVVVIYSPDAVPSVQESAPQNAQATVIENNSMPKSAPVVAPSKGDPHLAMKSSQDQTTPAVKPQNMAEAMSAKYAQLFAKSNLATDTKSFAESSNGSDTGSAVRKSLSQAIGGGGQLGTLNGGQVKGLAVDAGLAGKQGFQNKGLAEKSNFDSGYTAAKTVVVGSIDPELLRKILKEYIPQFRYCYQNELSYHPNLSGTIQLDFTLNAQGKVVNTNVKSKGSQFSQSGINCIAGVLKSIAFPAPKGGGQVDVRQPLNFSAERSKL